VKTNRGRVGAGIAWVSSVVCAIRVLPTEPCQTAGRTHGRLHSNTRVNGVAGFVIDWNVNSGGTGLLRRRAVDVTTPPTTAPHYRLTALGTSKQRDSIRPAGLDGGVSAGPDAGLRMATTPTWTRNVYGVGSV